MWYVVQTQSGNEASVVSRFKYLAEADKYSRCFVPMFEDVHKRGGRGQIYLRRFFPGYFFIETEYPDYVYRLLRRIPDFARLLGAKEESGDAIFIPVDPEDETFLRTLLEDGVMRVSLVKRNAQGRACGYVGPLAQYSNRITRLDVMRRRAIVELDVFGKHRRFKFGIWTESDPPLLRFKDMTDTKDTPDTLAEGIDIGIHEGDKVRDISGIWPEEIFTVLSVDPGRRLIRTSYNLLGTQAWLTLKADEVERVE